MPQRREFYELPKEQQWAVREYELRQILNHLVKHGMDKQTTTNFIIRALMKYHTDKNSDGLAWVDEIPYQMNKLTTKEQHLAYLYLKGIGINKISRILGMQQPTIEAFIASPSFNKFPSPHSGVWILTNNIEKAHDELVKEFIIVRPNICGGF